MSGLSLNIFGEHPQLADLCLAADFFSIEQDYSIDNQHLSFIFFVFHQVCSIHPPYLFQIYHHVNVSFRLVEEPTRTLLYHKKCSYYSKVTSGVWTAPLTGLYYCMTGVSSLVVPLSI